MKKLIICLILIISLPCYSKVIDTMDSVQTWESGNEEGTKLHVSLKKGKKGKALCMNYNFMEGGWVQVIKPISENLSKEKTLSFYYKASGRKNALQVKVEDIDGSTFGKKYESLQFNNRWHQIVLPIADLEYWWGGNKTCNLKKITKIIFAVSKTEGGKGKISIDQISTSSKIPQKALNLLEKEKKRKNQLYDNMEEINLWSTSMDNKTTSRISLNAGKKGKAFKFSYNFSEGNWTQIEKFIKWNIKNKSQFIFYVKGDGSSNNLQFKIEDIKGNTYGIDLKNKLIEQNWHKIDIPISSLKHFWGGDGKLDLKHIKKVQICITKNNANSGYLYIDEFNIQ